MSNDMKKHIQLIESALTENPLAAAALDQKKELEPNEAGSLGKLETE